MRLVVLGSGGYHPSETRHTACYFLPEPGVLLDCGTGAFRLEGFLPRERLSVLLSHGHLDHVVGLTYLLGFQARGLLGRVELYALPEVLDGIRQHLFSEVLFPVLPELVWKDIRIGEDLSLPEGGKAVVLPVQHRGPTVGYLLQWPTATVAYLTDTTVAGSRQHIASLEGIDLLMHEWYFPDGYETMAQETGHTCLSQVLQLGREVQPKRLLLIHLNPLMNSAKSWGLDEETVAEPPIIVAKDLLELQID